MSFYVVREPAPFGNGGATHTEPEQITLVMRDPANLDEAARQFRAREGMRVLAFSPVLPVAESNANGEINAAYVQTIVYQERIR